MKYGQRPKRRTACVFVNVNVHRMPAVLRNFRHDLINPRGRGTLQITGWRKFFSSSCVVAPEAAYHHTRMANGHTAMSVQSRLVLPNQLSASQLVPRCSVDVSRSCGNYGGLAIRYIHPQFTASQKRRAWRFQCWTYDWKTEALP